MGKLHQIFCVCCLSLWLGSSSGIIAVFFVLPVLWMTSWFHTVGSISQVIRIGYTVSISKSWLPIIEHKINRHGGRSWKWQCQFDKPHDDDVTIVTHHNGAWIWHNGMLLFWPTMTSNRLGAVCDVYSYSTLFRWYAQTGKLKLNDVLDFKIWLVITELKPNLIFVLTVLFSFSVVFRCHKHLYNIIILMHKSWSQFQKYIFFLPSIT